MGELATRAVVPWELRPFRVGLDGPGVPAAHEIAAELHVSVNTVSTHRLHLYAKLGVHSRREAVNRARALGLLAPSARRERAW